MAEKFKPLSPHLQIWRPTLTYVLSITHRILGGALYFGSVLFILWLGAAALGQDQLAAINGFYAFPLIQIGLFLYTWVLFHHLAGGIKHLIWDTGLGFGKAEREAISLATLIFSVLATLVVWAVFVWF
ncbi:succinate dehydrogenase, cytochrome b556 subunit [Pelagibacterium montanilacus]|uniref:succinate dehydrogenase, cytochrome b556 subunit n=1 Tax=Pelagibacterium montanilacus TaxID=2185280 RepID=UPI000F8C9418|nr:succinate dehydrogenase, cytochrome b556 subunit [Pelagibacterium montanilacus]